MIFSCQSKYNSTYCQSILLILPDQKHQSNCQSTTLTNHRPWNYLTTQYNNSHIITYYQPLSILVSHALTFDICLSVTQLPLIYACQSHINLSSKSSNLQTVFAPIHYSLDLYPHLCSPLTLYKIYIMYKINQWVNRSAVSNYQTMYNGIKIYNLQWNNNTNHGSIYSDIDVRNKIQGDTTCIFRKVNPSPRDGYRKMKNISKCIKLRCV